MTAITAGKLYTPELLSLATGLAEFPFNASLPMQGEARSRTCGSNVRLGLELADDGAVNRTGLAVTACAVGQASAAVFARGAKGMPAHAIASALAEIENWLEAPEAPLPEWPGFVSLEVARSYHGRHGALLLPWKAAVAALSKAGASG